MANISRPFTGSKTELAANIATHDWFRFDGETRCVFCDCRRYGRVAMWPCGQDQRIHAPVGSLEAIGAASVIRAAALIERMVNDADA